MKKDLIISLLVFALQSCGNPNKSEFVNNDSLILTKTGTIKHPLKDTQQLVSKSDSVKDEIISSKILGIWRLVGEANASFDVQKSKIFYPEFSKSYKYKIEGDSLRIKYDDYESTFLIKMNGKDTLILIGDEEQKYYRFKK